MHGCEVDGWPESRGNECDGAVDSVELGMTLPWPVSVGDLSATLVLDRGSVAGGGQVQLLLELDSRLAAERHRLGVRSLLCAAMGSPLLSAVDDAARFDEASQWATLVEGSSDSTTVESTFGGCPEIRMQVACVAVEHAGGLSPVPKDAASFAAAQDTVWANLVPSVEWAVSLLADHYRLVATLRDSIELASAKGRLGELSLADLRAQEAWLCGAGIPADLPVAWWGQTVPWAEIAIARAQTGDPDGAALREQLMPWLERLASVHNLRWHPTVVQFRLLIEAWRAALFQPSSATVRVDEHVLAQQWTVVQATI